MVILSSSKFPESTLLSALERSVKYSKDLRAANSATVQSARVLARKIDSDPESIKAATMQTFLKYCQALGFTLDVKLDTKSDDDKKPKKRELSPMERFLKEREEEDK